MTVETKNGLGINIHQMSWNLIEQVTYTAGLLIVFRSILQFHSPCLLFSFAPSK